MKINLLEDIVQRRRTLNEVAGIFHISKQSVSKWLSRYRQKGEKGVVPLKPGPKSGAAWNRTSEDTESIVCALAKQFPGEGPIFLALKLQELHVYSVFFEDTKHDMGENETGESGDKPCMSVPHQDKRYRWIHVFLFEEVGQKYNTIC